MRQRGSIPQLRQLLVPLPQDRQSRRAVPLGVCAGVTDGVFEAIEVVLEGAVVAGDQRFNQRSLGPNAWGFFTSQQIPGVVAFQSPAHHRQALINHAGAIGRQHQHRHRALR